MLVFLWKEENWKTRRKTLQAITCSAGVLLGRVNVTNLAIIYSTMSDLEIQAALGGRSREGRKIFTPPTPTPLLIFDCHPPPWYNFLSLPSLPLLFKSKMAAIIFAEKILSTRSPKWRLLCRLLKQGREPTTNSNHMWHQVQGMEPKPRGGRRALSPLCHSCSST